MEGNLGKAMALEKVMKKMKTRGYHTLANRQHPYIISNKNSLKDFGKQKDWIISTWGGGTPTF